MINLLILIVKSVVVWDVKDIIALSIIIFMGLFLMALNLIIYIQRKIKKKRKKEL